jgi:hypothetical protein
MVRLEGSGALNYIQLPHELYSITSCAPTHRYSTKLLWARYEYIKRIKLLVIMATFKEGLKSKKSVEDGKVIWKQSLGTSGVTLRTTFFRTTARSSGGCGGRSLLFQFHKTVANSWKYERLLTSLLASIYRVLRRFADPNSRYTTASVVSCSEFLAANPEFSGSIPGATRFFWVAVGLERGPLSSCEDKWGATWKRNSGSGLENWD